MTKTASKKFWIILTSCCIATGIAIACAGDWGEEYGTSNFSPEIVADTAYSPFFYSYQYYYGINYEDDQHTRFNNSNVEDWAGYFKNSIARNELQYYLQTASTAAIDSAVAILSGKMNVSAVPMSSFGILKQKSNKQVAAFFSYLQLAKKSEVFALNEIPYAWDIDTTKKAKTYNVTNLNASLLNAFTKSNETFLKERYWFQLLRSYYFNGKPQQAIDLFNSTEKTMPHDVMYFRSLSYTAGAYYKLKNFSKANYCYSLVYDGCNELKTSAHYSFHPQEEKDWNATLALCKNNEEKATLWQMLGVFYADEQRSINEIYQLSPASNKLDLLLARTVNKYEQKFSYKGSTAPDMPVGDTVAAQTLPALVNKIAAAGNTARPWVWQLAAGYLQTLDAKYAVAAEWYSKAAKTIPPTKEAQAQLRLLKLINAVGQAKRVDAKLEKDVLDDLLWLKNFDFKTIPTLRHNDAFEWAKQQLASKYQRQKDFVKAECFYSTNAFYVENKNIEAMKAFLSKTNKTPYEQLCADLSVKKADDLFEYQGITLAYADSLDAAIEKMAQAGAGANTEMGGNPFNARINDCHDCDHEAPQKVKYNKLALLKKLKELKEKANSGTDVYNNALLLANAYYNMSHFGNARYFYECKIIGSDQSDPSYVDSVFRKPLISMDVVTKYYTLAFKNATTDEQRAKCQYLLSKCQRNQWYNQTIYLKGLSPYDRDNKADFIAWDGFKALKQYANTQYYKDVIKECGYFKTYAQK